VPQEPGTMCARGMLLTNISFDFVRSLIAVADERSWRRVGELFALMHAEAAAWLERERVAAPERSYRLHLDARYQGQNFEVVVPLGDHLDASDEGLAAFVAEFAVAHAREYGYDLPGKPVEIVNCRLQAVGKVPKAPLAERAPGGRLEAASRGRRQIYFGDALGWVDTPVYERQAIPIQVRIEGPALIEEMSSTVALAPGRHARVDRIGNIVVHVKEHD